jgi:hypothetical protein
MQKVQAVNADFSPYVDANANPSLHQMVTQMISDKVKVETNEEDHTASDPEAASKMAGFGVRLLSARKDAPKIIAGGSHKTPSPSIAHGCKPLLPRQAIPILPCRNRWTARPSEWKFRARCKCSMELAPARRMPAKSSPTTSLGRHRQRHSSATACGCAKDLIRSSMCRSDSTSRAWRKLDWKLLV